MNGYLKRKLGLTDSGIKALKKSSILSFAINACYMSFMALTMYYGNNVLSGSDKPAVHYLIIMAVLAAVTYLAIDREYVNTFNATYKESAELRFEIADRIKKLPLSYFSKHNLSDMAQTIMQDVLDIEHALSHAMPRCIGYSGFLIVTAVLLLISHLQLGLAVVIPLAVGFACMYLSKNIQTKWTGKYFQSMRDTIETFQETIEMQREIRSYGMVEAYVSKTQNDLMKAERLRLKTEISQAAPLLMSMTLMKLALGVVATVASVLLGAGAVQIIYVLGFLLAAVRLVDAVGAIEESFCELFYLDARIKRINELRDTEIQEGKDVRLNSFDIVLENVHFGYNDEVSVVNGVSFTARQNEVTAIVGPSGCGKSTLLRLISRLYDYDRGRIAIDGQDIKEISTDSLFDNISFVFQDVICYKKNRL